MRGTKLKLEPQSLAWFGARLGKFTSSEIWKIINTGRSGELVTQTGRSYILSKVAEAVSDVAPEEIFAKSLDWGKENEPRAITAFTLLSNKTVETHTAYDADMVFGTPDGETETHVLEIKCPYDQTRHVENLLIADADELKRARPEYYWQLTMNMMLAGKRKGYFISYDPRMKEIARMKVIELTLNEWDVEALVERINLAMQLRDNYLLKLAKSL
jgi:hypothetical protein